MGTVKRVTKAAPKAKGKGSNGTPAPAPMPPPVEPPSLDALATALEERLTAFAEGVRACPAVAPFAQAHVSTCLRLERLSRALGSAVGSVYTQALAHHTAGGAFEIGKVAVSFPTKGGSRSPSWKDEATKQGAGKAGLEHGMKVTLDPGQRAKVVEASAQHVFDTKGYQEQVLANTPRGESKIVVEFTEGA